MIDPTVLTLLVIGTFTAGVVAGYVTGWDHGVSRGFDVGWKAGMRHVRHLIDDIRSDRPSKEGAA